MPSEAEIIRLWAARGVELLHHHTAELNTLNVFPVADADTGTNLYLTFQSAQDAELTRVGDDDDAFDALSSLAKGAVAAARGNSGVILAEALMGAVEGFRKHQGGISSILSHAAAQAREAVAEPQPGTILTILDSIADMNSDDPNVIAEHARTVLLSTRDLLPQLKKAGVVDAGGRGLVILLDALAQVCNGIEAESPPVGFIPFENIDTQCIADRAYEVIFKTDSQDMKDVQLRLSAYGTSITTTSDGVMMNVHVHTDTPKAVLSDMEQIAHVWDVKIEFLMAPTKALCGLVTVIEGIGNVMHLASLGINAINSDERDVTKDDVVQAVLHTNQLHVFVLSEPQYDAIIEEARSALLKFDVTVTFLHSRSIVSTLAAVSVFDQADETEPNRDRMSSAMNNIESLDLHGHDFRTLNAEKLGQVELVTLVWGKLADSSYQTALLKHMRDVAPTVTIIEITGDQSSSMAQVGLE